MCTVMVYVTVDNARDWSTAMHGVATAIQTLREDLFMLGIELDLCVREHRWIPANHSTQEM